MHAVVVYRQKRRNAALCLRHRNGCKLARHDGALRSWAISRCNMARRYETQREQWRLLWAVPESITTVASFSLIDRADFSIRQSTLARGRSGCVAPPNNRDISTKNSINKYALGTCTTAAASRDWSLDTKPHRSLATQQLRQRDS